MPTTTVELVKLSAINTIADNLAALTAADRVQTGLDAESTAADRVQTGLDAAATAADVIATAADRVQTGLDAEATAADRVQTGLDAAATAADVIATAADRVQTGLDAGATAADRVQTGLDAAATAADRVQTGLDVLAARASATAADASAEAAETAASVSGSVHFFDTFAAAEAAVSGLTAGAIVEVMADETLSGLRTRYLVESPAALAFRLLLSPIVTATAAALKAVPYSGAFTTAETVGSLAVGDNGGGLWRWEASSTATENGVTVIKPTGHGGNGRWLRVFTPGTESVTWAGAVGNGVADDTAAFKAAITALAGSKIHVPAGTYLLSEKLTIGTFGTWLVGSSPGWSGSGGSTTFKAAAGLTADHLVEFRDTGPNDYLLRSVGMLDIGLYVPSGTDCGGLGVYGAYDGGQFKNINIVGVAPSKIALLVSCGDVVNRLKVTQTAVFENIWAQHDVSGAESSAPAIRIYGAQECVFTNVKAYNKSSSVAACQIMTSHGLTLNMPTFVNNLGYGLHILESNGSNEGITVLNPEFENCKNTIKTSTEDAYLFGTISSIPSIGDIVTQPADGSTSTGVCWYSVASGVYVKNVTGTFTTGTLYKNGNSIGTISSVRKIGNKFISVINPYVFGAATVGSAGGGSFDALSKSRIELPSESNASYRHLNALTADVESCEFIAQYWTELPTVSSGAGDKNNKRRTWAEPHYIYTGSNSTSLYPFTSSILSLSSGGSIPETVYKFRITKSVNSGVLRITTSGVTVNDFAAGSEIQLYNGTLELQRMSSTEWVITDMSGNVLVIGVGRLSERPIIENKTSSFAADTSTVQGRIFTNTGATGTININLSAAESITYVGTKFTVMRTASQAIRIKPGTNDKIFGASANNKYLQLDTDDGFVTLELMNGKIYNVVASQGSYSFES